MRVTVFDNSRVGRSAASEKATDKPTYNYPMRIHGSLVLMGFEIRNIKALQKERVNCLDRFSATYLFTILWIDWERCADWLGTPDIMLAKS